MKKYILSLALTLFTLVSFSATFTAVQNGDWNDGATWGNISPGIEGTDYPGSSDTALTAGFLIGIASDVNVNILSIQHATAGSIFYNDQTFTFPTLTITVGNLLTSTSASGPTVAIVENTDLLVFDLSGTGTVLRNWNNSAPINTLTFSGIGSPTVASNIPIGGGTLTVSSGTSLTLPSDKVIENSAISTILIEGSLTILGGVYGNSTSTNYGTVTCAGTGIINIGNDGYLNSNTLNLNSGAIFNIANNQTNGWWNDASSGPASVTFDANSTVNYNRLLTQGIAARTYGNLSITSGGGATTKTLSAAGTLTVQGDLTIGTSTTFSTASNAQNIILQGNLTNDGVFTSTRPVTFSGGGTHLIDGGAPVTFNNTVNISASNTLDFDTDAVFGSTVSAGSNALTFAGNFTNNGTFNTTGTVTFDGAVSQSIAGTSVTSFQNLNINNTTTAVIMDGAGSNLIGTLTLGANGKFNANGKLTLVSTGASSTETARVAAIPASATLSGNFIYQRFVDADQAQQWHNIGSPVNGLVSQIVSSGFTVNGNDLARYNQTVAGVVDNGWELSTLPFTDISNTRGYTLWTRTADVNAPIVFTGALNTGNVNLTVTYTNSGFPSDDGWNLVNNPYASQIDWGSGSWTKTNINAIAAVFNPAAGSYNYLNASGTIASGQSFWVQSNAASPVLTARQAVTTSSGATFLRQESPINELLVYLKNNKSTDLARIIFKSDATEEFDTDYDARKLQNTIFNLSTITDGGENLAINTLPEIACSKTIKLKISNIAEGEYTLQFDQLNSFTGVSAFILNDSYLSSSTYLTEGLTYDFSVTAEPESFGDNRFTIEFTKAFITTDLNILTSNECDSDNVIISIDNAQNGLIYNLLKDDVTLASLQASGASIEFIVAKALLTDGLNNFDFFIENTACSSSETITNSVAIENVALPLVTATDGQACALSEIILSADGAPVGGSYRWYESSNAVESILGEESNQLIIQGLSVTKTYYVSAVNSLGCEGARTAVSAKVITITAPSVNNVDACSGADVSVIATGATENEFYNWYVSLDATDPIVGQNGSILNLTGINNSANYYVSITNSDGCEGPRAEVVVTVNELSSPELVVNGNIISVSVGDSYQWYRDNELIDGATNATFEVNSSGTYYVAVTSGNCSVSSTAKTFVITGLDDVLYELGLNIYPNPVVERLNIKNMKSKNITLTLFDSEGRLIFNHNDLKVNGLNSYFDMSGILKGMYILNIEEDSKIVGIRILKN